MTKVEMKKYKKMAKEACASEGIKVCMKDMVLLETGESSGVIDYVMFRDLKTGSEYQCFYGVRFYVVGHESLYAVAKYE